MATTFKVTIRTDQVNEEGKHAVRIRITKHRLVRYLNTGIYLTLNKDQRKSEWNPKATTDKANWVTSRHYDHAQYNDRLEQMLRRLYQLDTDNPTYTAQQIRDAHDAPEVEEQKTGFIAFAKEWIARKKKMGQHVTSESYTTAINIFVRFWGTRPDEPRLLTPSVMAEFLSAFRSGTLRGNGEGPHAPRTINTTLAIFRTMWRNGTLEGWIPAMPNPFSVPPQTQKKKAIERPTVQQIYDLMQLDKLTELETHVRNIFLMQFFLNGARVSEAYELMWQDVGEKYITYHPKKRAKNAKLIPRHDGIEWVLKQYPRSGKYVFPLMTLDKLEGLDVVRRTKRINTQISHALTRIAKKAGLSHLSSHMQRHTFADHVWSETKNIRTVQAMLGHNSYQSTEGYMSELGLLDQDNLNESLYSGIQVNARETNVTQGCENSEKKDSATKRKAKKLRK